jgi:hypothetical protein
MDFLNPKVLGDEPFFRQRYRLPIERYGDMASLRDLKARVGPFILRRLKTDKSIISDLPEKLELSEWVGLAPEQRKLYNKTVEESLDAIARAPLGQKHGQVLALLTKLKQICNHPALALKEAPEAAIGQATGSFASRSAKVQRLEEILEEVIEAGDRALLFTQFAEWGHLLKAHLERKLARRRCRSCTAAPARPSARPWSIASRTTPAGPQLFLLSLKAGGVGLNLTRASHVFHIDRWWNPAVENQATDRAYRIGQTEPGAGAQVHHQRLGRGAHRPHDPGEVEAGRPTSSAAAKTGSAACDVGQLKELVALSRGGLSHEHPHRTPHHPARRPGHRPAALVGRAVDGADQRLPLQETARAGLGLRPLGQRARRSASRGAACTPACRAPTTTLTRSSSGSMCSATTTGATCSRPSSQKARWSAQLLAGVMPADIERAFAASGKRLFPFKLQEVRSECSCPDKANPCKHVSAVFYLMGDRFSEDPFVLFQLRGRTRAQLLSDLAKRRRATAGPKRQRARAAADRPRAAGRRRLSQAGPPSHRRPEPLVARTTRPSIRIWW